MARKSFAEAMLEKIAAQEARVKEARHVLAGEEARLQAFHEALAMSEEPPAADAVDPVDGESTS